MGLQALEVAEYLDQAGESPFAKWFESLDLRTAARISRVLTRMALGNLAGVKSVGGGLLENRLAFGPGYRLYFGREGDELIILLAGGTKRRQQEDIRAARVRWADYKERRRGSRRGGIDTKL